MSQTQSQTQNPSAVTVSPGMSQPSGLTVEPLGAVVGAEIRGIDVARGLTEAEMSAVRDALHRHSVIVMRGQGLSPDDQVAFAKRLGTPRVSFFNQYAVEGCPELTVVSNIKRDGKPIGLVDAGALWHTDGSYLERPDMYTVLYALEIPHRDGAPIGDTLFVSTAAAYDDLPQETRTRIAGLRALHSITHHVEKKAAANLSKPPVDGAQRAALPDVAHPVVRIHPVTGRKCLFVTEGHTKSIVGMPDDESARLLRELWAQITRPAFVYRHKWQVGDLLIWDNCSTQHLAVTDYGTLSRRLHRSGIAGPVPV